MPVLCTITQCGHRKSRDYMGSKFVVSEVVFDRSGTRGKTCHFNVFLCHVSSAQQPLTFIVHVYLLNYTIYSYKRSINPVFTLIRPTK